MTIFLAVPYFKNSKYLEETLNSIISQTYADWQACVFDDSIDPVEASAAEQTVLKLAHPKISYQKNAANLGMAANWNQGLLSGRKSELVTLLHADDRLMPEYAQAMVAAASRYPDARAFFCRTRIIDDHGAPSFSFTDWYKKTLTRIPANGYLELDGIDGVRMLIPGNFVFCPTLCFRSRDLADAPFSVSFKMVLDFDWILRTLSSGARLIGIYSMPLYEYRRHTNNATNELNQSLVRFHEESALYDALGCELEKLGHFELAKEAKKKRIIQYNLWFLALKSFVTLHWGMTQRYLSFWSKNFIARANLRS